jgi:hypothetical protein
VTENRNNLYNEFHTGLVVSSLILFESCVFFVLKFGLLGDGFCDLIFLEEGSD